MKKNSGEGITELFFQTHPFLGLHLLYCLCPVYGLNPQSQALQFALNSLLSNQLQCSTEEEQQDIHLIFLFERFLKFCPICTNLVISQLLGDLVHQFARSFERCQLLVRLSDPISVNTNHIVETVDVLRMSLQFTLKQFVKYFTFQLKCCSTIPHNSKKLI